MFLVAVITFGVCLFLLLKATQNRSTTTILTCVVFFVLFRLSCFAGSVSAIASLGETDEPAQAQVYEATTEVSAEQTTEATEEAKIIELVAGEPGEYGELFTFNEGTEFEETYYIYHIPAGTYTVTNAGEYMNQFSVYSDEVHVVDGWEEFAETYYVKVLDVGESDTFTIEDGQCIEIHEPGRFQLENES